MFDPTWDDVESLIEELKNDGYEPSFLTTSSSEPIPEKEVAFKVERTADTTDTDTESETDG